MDKKALIICPVGCAMTFHEKYDKENHWRYTNKLERNYETLIAVYNDFEPEPNSYDHMIRIAGHKWQIIRSIPFLFDLSKYSYIACVDDDLITDIQSFNYGIDLALKHDFALWQLSMIEGSGIIYRCLMQNQNWDYSETNFIEMGSPFFRLDIFHKVIDFMNEIEHFEVGWGLDKMFCQFLDCYANVVHHKSIYHPPNSIKPSYYDQKVAMDEMMYMINHVYPRIMHDKYNKKNWCFIDSQRTIRYWEK